MEAKDLRRIARDNLRDNWWLSIGVALLASMLGGLLVGSLTTPDIEINIENQTISSISDAVDILSDALGAMLGLVSTLSLVQFILGGVIQLGYARFLLNQHDRSAFQVSDLFSQFDRFGAGFCQAFLRGLYVFLWSLLFIIPGIIAGYSYAMTPFIMAEHPFLSAREAIAESKKMMKGHKGELFWLDLTFIGWDLLCGLTFNLGHIALNPYKNAAYAAFYRNLTSLHPYNS